MRCRLAMSPHTDGVYDERQGGNGVYYWVVADVEAHLLYDITFTRGLRHVALLFCSWHWYIRSHISCYYLG